MIELGIHFGSNSRSRHSEWLRRQQWFIKAKQQHQRKDELEDRADAQFVSVAAAEVVANEIQINRFQTKLNTYDQATVDALIVNQELLDAVRAKLDDMLDRAYILEVGRRVFKSDDGTYVIDEFGELVGADVIDPDMIPDNGDTAEQYQKELDEENKLLADRDAIHEFDKLVGDARAEADSGEMTTDRMEELSERLKAKMPSSVRAQMPGFENPSNAPDASAMFSVKASVDPTPITQAASSTIQPEMP